MGSGRRITARHCNWLIKAPDISRLSMKFFKYSNPEMEDDWSWKAGESMVTVRESRDLVPFTCFLSQQLWQELCWKYAGKNFIFFFTISRWRRYGIWKQSVGTAELSLIATSPSLIQAVDNWIWLEIWNQKGTPPTWKSEAKHIGLLEVFNAMHFTSLFKWFSWTVWFWSIKLPEKGKIATQSTIY